ncbi:hypothetical protein HF086_004815 [Spodoptera exigua]|uniref:Peptidase S1 domain-containing protein n=1 Tax=Spodoptera exigua TaxID=7107 RepID=A0A922SAF1_SPOEX|nr:hypothetical protein HF086_004815 [Spodoptera exigua]
MFFKFLLCILMFSKVCLSNDANFNVSDDRMRAEEQIVSGEWVPRVVNGYPAKLGDVPYQIAMKALVNRSSKLYLTFCGATLVGPTKMITAAHCFEERGRSNCHKFFFPGLPLGVGEIDYASSPFEFNNHVAPIPYAKRHTDYNGKCLVSGYGRTGHGTKDTTEILLLANLEIMPNSLCGKVHRKRMENFVCTFSSFTDVGKGDSGGPLVCKNTGDPNEKDKGVLVGVVSGHSVGRGSFFTRVSKYNGFVTNDSISVFILSHYLNVFTIVTIATINKTFLF